MFSEEGKISLTFSNLSEEEAKCICSHLEMNKALDDIREHLRGLYKYSEFKHDETHDAIASIYDRYFEITKDITLL
jgi:hypothetical protein